MPAVFICMNPRHTLTVIIPAYNEERGIVQIIERVQRVRPALQAQEVALEVVVVDDGSRDRTGSLAASCANTRVVRHIKNRGYGAALKTGFRHANGDWLAFLDADGTYPPEALPEMCRALSAQRAAVVVGSRMSGAASEMPLTRRVGNLVFARLLSILSGVKVQDSASGMRVLRQDALPQLYPLPDGLDFTPAMTTRALNENLQVIEVPIAYSERIGRSKLSVVRDGVRFTNTIVWTTMTYNPVRLWGGIGLGLGALALLLALGLIVDWLGGNMLLRALAPLAAFAMLVLGITGATVFSFGVMFSYLIAIFTHKPVRRGMFGRVLFDPPLDYSFGWMGIVTAGAGVTLGMVALLLVRQGASVSQMWFWLVLSALLIVVGAQLGMAYLVIRVLDELTRREASAARDLADPAQPDEIMTQEPSPVQAGVKPQ